MRSVGQKRNTVSRQTFRHSSFEGGRTHGRTSCIEGPGEWTASQGERITARLKRSRGHGWIYTHLNIATDSGCRRLAREAHDHHKARKGYPMHVEHLACKFPGSRAVLRWHLYAQVVQPFSNLTHALDERHPAHTEVYVCTRRMLKGRGQAFDDGYTRKNNGRSDI